MVITRQLNIGTNDTYTPAKLQIIANYFAISNANACLFSLYWIYGVEGVPFAKYTPNAKSVSTAVFLYFSKPQLAYAEDTARSFGVNLLQLSKRAILELAKQIEDGTFDEGHPSIASYFSHEKCSDILTAALQKALGGEQ